jgi:hypothetical protein
MGMKERGDFSEYNQEDPLFAELQDAVSEGSVLKSGKKAAETYKEGVRELFKSPHFAEKITAAVLVAGVPAMLPILVVSSMMGAGINKIGLQIESEESK